MLTRGAVRGAPHLHVAVNVRVLRDLRIQAHLLPALRGAEVGRGAVLVVVVRSEQAVHLELAAFAGRVSVASVQRGGGEDPRAEAPAVLGVLQGLQHRVARRVREPLPRRDGTVQTPLHQDHLFSYPLHHEAARGGGGGGGGGEGGDGGEKSAHLPRRTNELCVIRIQVSNSSLNNCL